MTRFRPLVKLYRTGFPPAGLLRKVSDLHSYISSSSPKLAWRNHIDRRSERFCDKSAGVIKLTAIKVLFLATSAITRIPLIWQNWGRYFNVVSDSGLTVVK